MATMRQTRRSRTLPVSRTRAWRVLTHPATAPVWLGGHGAVDLRAPGNTGVLSEPDGTLRHVVVDAAVPGERVRLRWWTDRGPGVEPSVVEIDLAEDGEVTVITATETALADAPLPLTAP